MLIDFRKAKMKKDIERGVREFFDTDYTKVISVKLIQNELCLVVLYKTGRRYIIEFDVKDEGSYYLLDNMRVYPEQLYSIAQNIQCGKEEADLSHSSHT